MTSLANILLIMELLSYSFIIASLLQHLLIGQKGREREDN